MKKFIIGLVVLFVLVFGGLKIYEITNYGGTIYYTQIKNTGTKETRKDDSGVDFTDYRYDQNAYDENGEVRKIEFYGNKSRPLKMHAYLKMTYNEKKGVTRWEAVNKSSVPKKALDELNE